MQQFRLEITLAMTVTNIENIHKKEQGLMILGYVFKRTAILIQDYFTIIIISHD